MKKTDINKKATLAWERRDFLSLGLEVPECVLHGQTEGESMDIQDIEKWFLETKRTFMVLAEEYPEKFTEQYRLFKMDLEYLESLGKINKRQKVRLANKENFFFD